MRSTFINVYFSDLVFDCSGEVKRSLFQGSSVMPFDKEYCEDGYTESSIDINIHRYKLDCGGNGRIVPIKETHENVIEIERREFCIWHVKMNVEVEAGPSRKAAAVRGAKKLGATWIILDRELKKDKQYFMDRLLCGISSMKSNNTVVEVRGPIRKHVSYDEMIPSYSWEELSPSQQSKYVYPEVQFENMDHLMKIYHHTRGINIRSPSILLHRLSSTMPFPLKEKGERMITIYIHVLIHGIVESPATQKASSFKEQAHNRCSRHFLDNSKVLASTAGIIETRQTMGKVMKLRQTREEFESTCSVCRNKRPKLAMQRDFTFEELYDATGGFSDENFISEGGFGFVFKGVLENGLKIAVKQHKAASLQGEREFKSEVHVLSHARHQNLVMLLGSCSKGSQRLLVSEYVCNGSLEELLSGNSKRPLNWEKRIKIALGAAKGLECLHARNIVHRDMRPSNILITHDHESRLGDFGLAKAQEDDSVTSYSGMVGTLGYMAQEYAEHGKMSTKTDVYSFGMVMLQLITGLRTTDKIPEGKSLVGWAKPLLESKNYPDLIDKRIANSHDVHQLLWMVRVAESCLKKDPNVRCTMEQVVHDLSCIGEDNTNFIRHFFPTDMDSDSEISIIDSHVPEDESK
ncbi:inactive protein kinase SELMODRAFT_444075-like [Olea europaea var. sylvestris]|uniref:inactive protein kinase SELMODRAFT_444075-like n=1 Tax=Olea europaea var. sylvestris TaxID=158386 RepID=UPI000C1D0679|nr:inactive protein kinase SELMODRAFT_444075-like [Olea europaea var. sylvestris]